VTVDGYAGTIQAGEGARQESRLEVYDQSDLFCFDTLQPLSLSHTHILLEPSYSGPVLYLPPTLNEEHQQKLMVAIQKEVNTEVRLGLPAKYAIYFSWQSRMDGNPLFRELFFKLVRACIEMSPERLERLIEQTYLFTQMLLSELEDVANDTEIHALLTAYAKLDTANGNYMLVNTILPEGYGIRSVYQAASPYFTEHQLSFGEFLANRGGVQDSQASRIFAVYDLLTHSREESYLKYKMLGATASTFAQHWTTVLDRLAQLLGLDPDAENFKSSLFQQVEAFNIWPDIHALFATLT
jgi:hypothetical protein